MFCPLRGRMIARDARNGRNCIYEVFQNISISLHLRKKACPERVNDRAQAVVVSNLLQAIFNALHLRGREIYPYSPETLHEFVRDGLKPGESFTGVGMSRRKIGEPYMMQMGRWRTHTNLHAESLLVHGTTR